MSDGVGIFNRAYAVVGKYITSSQDNSPEKGGVPSSDPLARDSLGTKLQRVCVPIFSAGWLKPYPGAMGMGGLTAGVLGRRVLTNGNEY